MAEFPGVQFRRVSRGDSQVMGHVCTCSGCGAETTIYPGGSAMPPDGIAQRLRVQDWRPDFKRGRHLCPDCVRASRASPEHKPSSGKVADMRPPKPVLVPAPGAAEAPLREVSPADKRRIFRRLDEVYDDAKARFCEDWTDAKVASGLDVPRAWVTQIREEAFGPDGNQEIERLQAELGNARGAFKALSDKAMQLATDAEAQSARLSELEAKIKKALGAGA